MNASTVRRLRAALGDGALVEEPGGRWCVRGIGAEPVRRAIELLAEERVSFAPSGAGTTIDAPVRVRAPQGVLDLWTDELVVRVGAGTTLAALDHLLAPHGLCLGVADGAAGSTALGALFAAADRGLRGSESLRERTLGLTLVDGTGRVLRSGARVVKSVAGYDLTRLHWGARGSLGLILDFTLRVRARPQACAAVAMACEPDALIATVVRSRSVVRDAYAELWIAPACARALGLPARATFVCAREGGSEGLREWARALGGTDLDVSALAHVAALSSDPTLPNFLASGVRLRSLAESGMPFAAEVPWVVDLLAQQARWSGPFVPAVANAVLWAENALARAGRPTHAEPARARAERSLRAVFDPHGVLPASPAPLATFGEEVGR